MAQIIKPAKTISEQVLEHLEKEILSGHYKPGDRMVETEIAGRLGVSRGPVREALLVLERRGLIQEKDGLAKGREVVSLSEQDLREIYQVRIFIEAQCLISHARKQDPQVLDELENMVREMDRRAAAGDLKSYREANSDFHHFIVRAIDNQRLYDYYVENERMIHWFMGFTLHSDRLRHSNQEHKAIIAACRRQDTDGIIDGLYEHQNQALVRVLERIEKVSPGG